MTRLFSLVKKDLCKISSFSSNFIRIIIVTFHSGPRKYINESDITILKVLRESYKLGNYCKLARVFKENNGIVAAL